MMNGQEIDTFSVKSYENRSDLRLLHFIAWSVVSAFYTTVYKRILAKNRRNLRGPSPVYKQRYSHT